MLATSPSPSLHPEASFGSRSPFITKLQYEHGRTPSHSRSPSIHLETSRQQNSSPRSKNPQPQRRTSARSLDGLDAIPQPRKKMVDASTQYSPPEDSAPLKNDTQTPTSRIAGLELGGNNNVVGYAQTSQDGEGEKKAEISSDLSSPESRNASTTKSKRHAAESLEQPTARSQSAILDRQIEDSPSKRPRPDAPDIKILPAHYEDCDTRDLVILISSMLLELIRFNDEIPLRDGHLTRFHSRAPPGISVLDYLQRLTTHATLSPPILLSMVYYIDKLCALYPDFTISSLTVHRFLIASATVASKGLSDSFWTNKVYARVGGVSLKELALLELEFLTKVEWRIVPLPEVLNDYYKSLVERSPEHTIDTEKVEI